MGNNSYIKERDANRRAHFKAGIDTGRQQVIDMVCLVLNDPDIMKTDVFGKDRILAVLDGICKKLDYFDPAFSMTDETDYYQDQMDKLLAKILRVDAKDLQFPFNERYPYCRQYDYKKGRWVR